MLPSSRALLSPLLLLIIAGSNGAFSSRPGECMFPLRWEGTWFQSGVRQPIVFSKNELSTKGKCLHNEGDKFLMVDHKSCHRCVVIHEKHLNVLQYKETLCHTRISLSSLCAYITGDALLFSMFREEAAPIPCPFRGPMTLSYNRGHGVCSVPASSLDICVNQNKLMFRYQACPDVSASESAEEELECLGTWKEGTSRYLVGRLHYEQPSSSEDRFRCFVFEKVDPTEESNQQSAGIGIGTMFHSIGLQSGPVPEGAEEVYRVSQSGDATCNGLFSPMEGSRIMTMARVSTPSQCRFPNWLTGHSSSGLTWHTLDLTKSYTFHPRNASLHITRLNSSSSRFENGPLDGQYVPDQEDQEIQILCNSIKQSSAAQAMTMIMLVAHFTIGCRSSFMCMTFYRRDGHVIEVQNGNTVERPEEACNTLHFQQHNIPFLTLVTSSPEPRTCPYLGKFTVTEVNRNQRNIRESRRNQHQEGVRRDREKVRHAQERTQEDRRGRKLDFDVEKRRANNEYLVHERMGRRARSNRNNRNHRDHSLEEVSSKRTLDIEDLLRDHSRSKIRRSEEQRSTESVSRSKLRRTHDLAKRSLSIQRTSNRSRRNPKMEDFRVDADDFTRIRQFWTTDFDDPDGTSMLEIQADYFGDYPDTANLPKKRSGREMTSNLLTRMSRNVEELDPNSESFEKRDKREEDISRCNSEVTTITIGCSTADRMEFQTDCVEDNAIAYSCHGRWFDAEGTQFVIATQLAPGTSWSREKNRPQSYRNSRRLCFIYKESDGVVSLTASEVACQRGNPPPPPMLVFNATSIGQCIEESSRGFVTRSTYLMIVSLAAVVAIYR